MGNGIDAEFMGSEEPYDVVSRSLWGEDLKILPESSTEIPAVFHGSGPQGQPLLIWSRRFSLIGHAVVIAVAEDLNSKEIVVNYEGVIEFSRSPELKGLLVRVSLPR